MDSVGESPLHAPAQAQRLVSAFIGTYSGRSACSMICHCDKCIFLQGMGVMLVNIHRAFCNGARDPGASYINSIFQPITGSSLPLVALFSLAFVKETCHIRDGAVLQFCNAKKK